MNLSKENFEKLVLLLLLLAGGLYLYGTMLIEPLRVREQKDQKAIAELAPKISAAKTQLSRTRALEAKAPEATKDLAFIISSTPKGAPLAWFPPRLNEFFVQHSIAKTNIRLTEESAESDGFRQLKWRVDLPGTDVMVLGKALAALENREVLLEITALQVETVAAEPLLQNATLSFSTWIKQ